MAAGTRSLDARYKDGNAQRMAGDFAAAEKELRGVLADDPTHRDAAYSLAFMLREQGRTTAASTVVSTWWQHAKPDADATLSAIGFLIECASYESAGAIGRAGRQRWPNDARLAGRVGETALALGHFDAARAALDSAVTLDVNQSASWLRLSHCQRYRDVSERDFARFASVIENKAANQVTRACAGFALGKAFDDVGGFERAATTLSAANSLARQISPWNVGAWRALVERRLHEEFPAAQSPTRFSPIFIIGMPRTGTTLVSTLLSRSPDVRDRGELNWIPAIYAQLAEAGRLSDADALTACARLVEIQMRRDDAPARWYVDKNPLNFAYADFILALFPNARFVYCRRDARDTALSIWMQHFAHEDLGFAYDFSTISQVDNDHRRLMQRWAARFAARIFELDYETLVADADAQADRLADFLSIQSGLRDSRKTMDRTLTTASVWQARQPIYTRSLQRWRSYAPFIPQLESLFGAK
ncbi:MAG TPA: sulfotransferase [Rudaea sp.]|jgi:Tfp pilus assembly protein PilF|nr:sulfotransferase [Rudaea sp.]